MITILQTAIKNGCHSVIAKKLTSLTSELRKSQLSTREALNWVKLNSRLLNSEKLTKPSINLLLVAVAAIEKTEVPKNGPQRRSKEKTMRSAYHSARKAIQELVSSTKDIFFSAAGLYAKRPHEAVAALGLMSTYFDNLQPKDRERYLELVWTMCMKTSLANECVRACSQPLSKADQAVFTDKILPMIRRALLREPQSALPATSALVRGLKSIDISAGTTKTLVPAIVQAVKSSDETTRKHGVALAMTCGVTTKQKDAVLDAVKTLFDLLKNARYAYQKVSCVQSLSGIVVGCEREAAVYEAAISDLNSWLSSRRETNEEARFAGMEVMHTLFSLLVKKEHGKELSAVAKKCVAFFADVLSGKTSDADQRALLTAMSDSDSFHLAPNVVFGSSAVPSLTKIVETMKSKRQEVAVRAICVLTTWDSSDEAEGILPSESKIYQLLGQSSSPILQDPSTYSSLSEVRCVIRCLRWMITSPHSEHTAASDMLARLGADSRDDFAAEARKEVRKLQKLNDITTSSSVFYSFWTTHFSPTGKSGQVAKSYNFDDGHISSERLGRALLSAIFPNIPLDYLKQILLASHHPRLVEAPSLGRAQPLSRYWLLIERHLEKPETEYSVEPENDWLEKCLEGVFGEEGLRSENPTNVQAAISGFSALAHPRNPYSTRVLRRGISLLEDLASPAAKLGEEDFTALKIVLEAEKASSLAEEASASNAGGKRSAKKSSNAANARANQRKQAAVDRARAAAATATVAVEKAKAAEPIAKAARHALLLADIALRAISAISSVAPRGVHNLLARMLSIVLPLAKLERLEVSCREAISALSETAQLSLRGLQVPIASCLYGLEREYNVQEIVASVIRALKDRVPPALEGEDFSLVLPLIRAALLRDPDSADRGTTSRRRGSTARRDITAVVKAAAQVLVEHCKPEAVDSAVVAARCSAGSWTVQVLEREDGAFAAAADALAYLAGTVISPGTPALSQVLEGIVSGKSSVRDAALAALARIPSMSNFNIDCPRDAPLGRGLWLAKFDPDEANAELADELWNNYKHPLYVPDDVPAMLGLLAHAESDIRVMAAKAVAAAVCGTENENTRNACIPQMFTIYLKNLLPGTSSGEDKQRVSRKDGFPPVVRRGRDGQKASQEEDPDKGWPGREGVALAIEQMAIAEALVLQDVTACFSFLSGRGLGDQNNVVRAKMSKAAIAVVQAAGMQGPAILLPMIEKQLNTSESSAASEEELRHADRTRENLVMCLGSVASFLPAGDARIEKIANQVIKSAMETPSEVVQNAAARCLAPLANAAIKNERETEISKRLLDTVWSETATYGERRGAAYALAGISRGMGLKFVKRSGLMTLIHDAVSQKDPRRRQGGFLLIETHAILLEKLFEPYAVSIVPFLLQCMGDSVMEVRNACWAAAQAAMSEISSLGVKMILPSLLNGLRERQWRTKAGSAEVLGAMAYCAPRQLAQCLPQVVPMLAESLADAHPKVVSSAESAINRIAAVVRSPEVRKLSPFLLAALRDPAGRTKGAIDAMLGSEFVHAIDAASLALLIPPLHRGLRDRSSELKRKSAAIVGSMCNNVSSRHDVVPYLDLLLPSLRVTLLDAIPDVRRTSARALGALAVSLGEQGLPEVVPWLVNAILGGARTSGDNTGERPRIAAAVISSSAERSGAAMGLAEVAASMSERRLEDVLSTVLKAGHSSAEAREGGLMLIASMPRALGERFEERLGTSLTAILQGLSDDADSVREAALEAGRNLVSAYAKTSLEHLLPELLSAMREKLWRIRLAATRLLGDMLLVIAGAAPERPDIFGSNEMNHNEVEEQHESENEDGSEKDSDEEGNANDADFESPEQAAAAMTTEAAMKAIGEVLGFDRRNDVLAALYIIRCDVSVRVRQMGMQVWKSVVANTPRVLREIMPSAVRQIVEGLGNEDDERRAAAGKTLSDLSQKLGDRVVPEVLPALRAGICEKTNSARVRRGACEGLGELVLACPIDQLEDHAAELVEVVNIGLVDELSSVREIAAEVFASLWKPLGTTVVDAVIPKLIGNMSSDSRESEIALHALQQISMASDSKLMAIVIPKLLSERPLKVAGARSLATAASAAETSFEPYISDVVSAVVDSLEELEMDAPVEHFGGVLAAIGEGGEQSVKTMLDELVAKFNEGYAERRLAASRACAEFCRKASLKVLHLCYVRLLEVLIRQLADTDEDAARGSWEALKVLTEVMPNDELSARIPVIRQSLRAASTGISVTDSTVKVTALQMPKAPAPFVPLLCEGLLNGAPELQEQAALAIGELVELTNPKSLGPFAIKLAGPLIRVVSVHMPWQVKAAVLKSLLLLLKKGSLMLRTFVPQLHKTFLKCLSDRSRLVRRRSVIAIGALVPIQGRLEQLLNDLVSLGLNAPSAGTRIDAFHSCSQVFRRGKKMPEAAFGLIAQMLCEALSDEDKDVVGAAARALGYLAARSSESSQYTGVLDCAYSRVEMKAVEYTDRVGAMRAMGAIFAAGKNVSDLSYADIGRYVEYVMSLFDSTLVELRKAACAASAKLFLLLNHGKGMKADAESHKVDVVMKLGAQAEYDESAEGKISALDAIKKIVREDDMVFEFCGSALIECAGATNTAVRERADRALRRAFVKNRELGIDEGMMQVAKNVLDHIDLRFIDRRLEKLLALVESEDEAE